MAGVVNIILRKDYTGAETASRYGDSTSGGGGESAASQIVGTSWSGGNAMITVDYQRHGILDASQREYLPDQPRPQSLIPNIERKSFVLSGNQDLGAMTNISALATYRRRDTRNFATVDSTGYYENDAIGSHVEEVGLAFTLDQRLFGDWHTKVIGDYSSLQQSYSDGVSTNVLGDFASESRDDNKLWSVDWITDGPIAKLPGGVAKGAVGVGYRKEEITPITIFAFPGSPAAVLQNSAGRHISDVFGELSVPMVGAQNSIRLVNKLDLSLAARYDRYSDFGGTTNPKIGVTWELSPEIAIKSTFGTSYRAPSLFELDTPQMASTSLVGNPAAPGVSTDLLVLGGGNPNLVARRKARSYTFGLDVKPRIVDGLTLRANYFHVVFRDRIGLPPVVSSNFFDPVVAPFLNTSPSLQEVQAAFNSSGFSDGAGGGPAAVQAIFNDRYANIAQTVESGVDTSAAYIQSIPYGRLTFSLSGVRQIENRFTTISTTAPVDLLNTVGEPLKFRAKATSGWDYAGLESQLTFNYAKPYNNTLFTPAEHISSWETIDLHVGYHTGAAGRTFWTRNLFVGLSVLNACQSSSAVRRIAHGCLGPGTDTTSVRLNQRVAPGAVLCHRNKKGLVIRAAFMTCRVRLLLLDEK